MQIPNLLFDKHPHPIIAYDVETLDILKVNQCACITYGYTEEEFLDGTIQLIRPENNEQQLRKNLDLEAENKIMDRGTVEHKTCSGERIRVNITTQSIDIDDHEARLISIRDVTHFTDIQDKLRRKHDRLEKAQKLADVAWWELDAQSGKVEWSQKLYEMLGLDHDDIEVETDFRKYVHPDDEEELNRAKKEMAESEESVEYLIRLQHSNGQYLYMKCRAQASRNGDGEVEQIRGVAQDVTKEQQNLIEANKAKAKLEKQKDFAEKLIANLPDIFLLMKPDGSIAQWNNHFEEVSGYEKKEIEGSNILSYFADAERPVLEQRLQQAFNDGSTSTEGTLVTKDGERIPHKLDGIHFDFEDESFVAGIGADISERIKNEHKLEEKSQRLQRAKEIAKIGSYVWDVENNEINWSDRAYEIYGVEKDSAMEINIQSFLDVVHPNDRNKVIDHVENMLEGDGFEKFTHRITTPDGKNKVIVQRGRVDYDDLNNAKLVFGTVQDITKQYEQQQEIERKEQLFESLFKDAPVAMLMGDTEQHIMMVNDSFEELYGYTQEELKGENLFEVLMPEEAEVDAPGIYEELLGDKNRQYYETKRIAKNGDIKEVLIGALGVEVDDEPEAVFGIHVDMTKLKTTEKELKESLEQKEILLSEIHHRVKNNLAIISGLLEMESYNWDSENSKVGKAFRNSQLRIQSIAKIHEKLYESEDLANLKFNTYLREFIHLVLQTQTEGTKDIELNIDCDENIQMNVNQAMPTALIINELVTNVVEHAFADHDEPKLTVSFKEDRDQLKLTINDNGNGLPEDLDEHPSDSLGMTIVEQLVKQLDADFEVHQNGGTSYNLSFKKGEVSGSSSNYFV